MKLAALKYKTKIFYMENGLIPGMTTLDNQGINYLNSVPRNPDFFSKHLKKNSNNLTKNITIRTIFIPFQVNTDSQIVKFSPWVKDMFALVEIISEICEYLPKEYKIIFKTHPKCPENYSNLIKSFKNHPQISFDNTTPTNTLIKKADIICTINSTVGIEGLIQRKKIITLGDAFYNINGLVQHAENKQKLIEILRKIDNTSLNLDLVKKFLDYMINEYQIPGKWQNPDEGHFDSLTLRIKEFVELDYQQKT
jgi:capsular polysaccharide export protein